MIAEIETRAKDLAETIIRGIQDGSMSVDRLAYMMKFMATPDGSGIEAEVVRARPRGVSLRIGAAVKKIGAAVPANVLHFPVPRAQ